MNDEYRAIFARNIGILREAEQEKLCGAKIAIAGVGGVGGLLAERLIRMGVGQLKITDPGAFEESNFNRQFASSMVSRGKNKAAIVFAQIKDINPQARIDYNDAGISSEEDANCFVEGSDVVIDEMDFGLFKQSISLQRAARGQGKYYLFASALGFGALLAVFDPKGLTLEEFDRLTPGCDLNRVSKTDVPTERVIPIIPSYAPADACQALKDVYAGKRTVPTTSIGVGLASILATMEAVNIILRKREIAAAPRYTYIDLLDGVFTIGRVS